MPTYSELNDFYNLAERQRRKVLATIGKERQYLVDFYKLPDTEKKKVLSMLTPEEIKPIEPSPFKTEFAPAEPATTAIRPEAPMELGIIPSGIEKLPERAIIESKAKDIADALYLGGSHMWHQTKQYFRSTLPGTYLTDINPGKLGHQQIPYFNWTIEGRILRPLLKAIGPTITKEQAGKLNITRRRWLGEFKKKYDKANRIYAKQIIANPKLKPRKEWSRGVVETIKENPKILLDPAYWGYVAAQSAAFTTAVMGTTLGITALTKNPILGMAAGMAIATPAQSQDLMDELIKNGMKETDAAQLAMPIGAMIASVEVLGDLPILAALSKPFANMLRIGITKEVGKQVAKRTVPIIAKRGIKTFLTIEGFETIEEVVQNSMQGGTVKTVAQNKGLLQTIVEIIKETPEIVARTAMATAPFAMVGAGAQMRTAAMRPEIVPTEVTKPVIPTIEKVITPAMPSTELIELNPPGELTRRATKVFGLTGNPNEAGYILSNGRMLDLSGKRIGGTPGQRMQDHREISHIFDTKGKGISGTDAMINFEIQANAIRFHLSGDGDLNISFDLSQNISDSQWGKLAKIQKETGGEIFYDIYDNKTTAGIIGSGEEINIYQVKKEFNKLQKPEPIAEEIAKLEKEFPYMTEEARIDAERRARLAAEKPLPPVEKKVEPTLTTKEKDLFEKIKTRLGEETKIESINKLSERIVKRIGVPLGKRVKAKMDLTRRAILDVKRDIRKKAKKIAKLDLKGLDPEDRAEIEVIRNNIDPSFRTKKTLMRRKGTLEYVKRMKEEEQEITVPADVLKMLYKIPLNQMTPAEFEQSYNAVMTIYQQAKLKNKLLKTLGDRDYNKTKQQLIGELRIQQKPIKEPTLPQLPKTLKAAKERRSFKKLWQRYLLEARIPVDFFELLDGHKVGTFSKVFWDSSEDALTNELKLVDKRKKEIKDFVEKLDVNQDDLMFKFETINKKWKLPPAMKMGVYIYSQNPTARLSLGIVEGFSEQDITDVINKLTVKEKKIADGFIRLCEKYYNVENGKFNILHGFDMPREPNYFPIMRDFSAAELPKYKLEEIKKLFEKTGFRQPYVERGWSIKRIPKPSPTTPPMFLDIFKVMDRHIHSTSHFITHGELIRDLRKLANDKELNAELIKTFRNKKINQELLDYVRNIANYNETDPMSNWAEKISRALRSGIVPAYLGLNIVTSFRQPISWLLGASEIGLNWATAGTLDFVTEPRKVLNFIRETNPQIAPEHRFIERDIREMLGPEAYSKFKRFNRKKKRFFMVLLRATDQPTVCAIYRGGYLKGRHRGMSHEDAVSYARRVIEKTQPMGRRKSVPKLFRGNELLRWFTMFKNQPVRIFNYMLEDIIGKRAARNISTYDALRRILLILVSAQAMGIVSRGRFRRDRREQIIDTISFHIFGAPIIGALIDQQLRGFKSEFIPFRFVNDIGRIFKSKTAPTKWKYVMKTIAILNGIPWNQPYRTGVAISKLMKGKGIDLRELIWSKYQLKERKAEKPKSRKLTPMEIDRLLGK